MSQRPAPFYTGPGLKLSAFLEVPNGPASGKRPGIVMCPGPYGTPESTLANVAARLAAAGYVALCFDHRGFGQSEGPRNRFIPLELVEDIGNALTFLEQQPEVDGARLGLWGSATGSATATYTAAIDKRCKCMVAVTGMGDMARLMRSIRRYWEWVELLKKLGEDGVTRVLTGKSALIDVADVIVNDPASVEYKKSHPQHYPTRPQWTLESIEAVLDFKPESVVDRIGPRAAMWIHAGDDMLIPIDESRSLYEKAREPKKLVVLEGGFHQALHRGPGFDFSVKNGLEWLDAHLKA